MVIKIKNMRDEKPVKPWDVRVDRNTPLGNPFFMKDEDDRDRVCDKYDNWFDDAAESVYCQRELDRLIDILHHYGKINLFCWCAPKRCHAETIKAYLIEWA